MPLVIAVIHSQQLGGLNFVPGFFPHFPGHIIRRRGSRIAPQSL
jgi:hypothetical protein